MPNEFDPGTGNDWDGPLSVDQMRLALTKQPQTGSQALQGLRAQALAGSDAPFDPVGSLVSNVKGLANTVANVPSNLYNMATNPKQYFQNMPAPSATDMAMGFNPAHIGEFAGVVKPKGGNWYDKGPYSFERDVDLLKADEANRAF